MLPSAAIDLLTFSLFYYCTCLINSSWVIDMHSLGLLMGGAITVLLAQSFAFDTGFGGLEQGILDFEDSSEELPPLPPRPAIETTFL